MNFGSQCSIHQHLERAGQPFWCLFFPCSSEWLNTLRPSPPQPLIPAGAWLNRTSSPWRLRRWHLRMHTHRHTHRVTDLEMRLASWVSCRSVWLDEKLFLQREDRSADWAVTRRELCSALSSLSVKMDRSLFVFHSVRCKPFLWVIPNKSWRDKQVEINALHLKNIDQGWKHSRQPPNFLSKACQCTVPKCGKHITAGASPTLQS